MEPDIVSEDTQITCKFVTQLAAQYRVPETPVAVPANLTRYGLSHVINHLLALEAHRPFDFLVAGELLRVPLAKFLAANNTSAESVLVVEYTFAVLPPKAQKQVLHDDWVRCVDGSRTAPLVTGCYDGIFRVWRDATESPVTSTTAHEGPITAVALLPKQHGNHLVTSGKDHRVRLWEVPALAGQDGMATAVAEFRGHTDAVEAVEISPEGTRFATAGWDNAVHLWRAGTALLDAAAEARQTGGAGEAAAPAKKRKAGEGRAAPAAAVLEEQPRDRLSGHVQCVSSLAWPSEETLFSGSCDHSVRQWDAETTASTAEVHVSQAVYAVAAPAGSGQGPVAFGGAGRALHLWDPRTINIQRMEVQSYSSHTAWISAVAWHPRQQHHLATASYDGTVKLWDARSSVPLHTICAHKDKVLCVTWAGSSVVSGGADSMLSVSEVELPQDSQPQ